MTDQTPFERVLGALDQLGRRHRGDGSRVAAQCPAHDDTNASLSVCWDGGKVLVNCHAGCRTADVVVALGLTWQELFEQNNNAEQPRARATKPEIVAVYDYVDEWAGALFEKVRYAPKDFRIRRPDGNGDWIWSLGDTRKVPYNLHLVTEAMQAGKSIVICEGEKDADRVVKETGLAASCNFEGAAKDNTQRPKWRREYSEHFRNGKVLVVADNDEAGLAHAQAVAESLRSVNATVRVFKPAVDQPKADISDHFDAGFGLGDLVPIDDLPATNQESNETNETTKQTPTLHPSAYHGVLGAVVRKLEPATEASPAAMLVQLIACVGAYTGDRVTTLIGGSLHPVRIWPLVIGPTSSGRKGESRAQVQRFVSSFSSFNSYFVDQESGLSTGEGLLHRLKNDETDTGKTLIVWETEFGRPLAASRREGNTLSHVLRDLWDDGKGSSMTKADPVTVTGAHLIVIGHITPKELRVKLTEVDISGGLANRFLTFWARRTKLLADQVAEPDTRHLAKEVDDTLTWVSRLGTKRIQRAPSAADYWRRIYKALADQEVEGPLGELLARAPAYVLRIALAYALMDRATEIGVVHLRAALAMVSYAIDSATYVFGDTAGTGDLGKLSQALRAAGTKGMARTDISKLFSGNRSVEKITALVSELVSSGDAKEHTVTTGQRGRNEIRTVWVNRPHVHPLGGLLDEPVPTNNESNEKNHAEQHDVNGDADSGPTPTAGDVTVDDNGRPYGVWRVSGQRAAS